MWNRAMLALLPSLLIAGGAGAATVTQEQIQRAALFTERAETVRDGSVPIVGERLGRSRWLDDHRVAYEAIDRTHAVRVRIVDARTGVIRPSEDRVAFDPETRWPDGADQSGEPGPGWVSSPDGAWRVIGRGADLAIVREAGHAERRLTAEGSADNAYGDGVVTNWSGQLTLKRAGFEAGPSVSWSPDSRLFVTFRADARATPLAHYVETVPLDDAARRPLHHVTRTAFPGEPAPALSFMIFDAANGSRVDVRLPPMTFARDPVRVGNIWWAEDGRNLYLRTVDVRAGRTALWRIDPRNGAAVALIEEGVQSLVPPTYDDNAIVRDVPGSDDILWYSQRDDYGHLYRYSSTGRLLNRVTSGRLYVAATVAVTADWIYFLAGKEDSADPYQHQLYRVRRDGRGQQQLTDDGAQHDASPSPRAAYFLLRSTTLDRPTSATLIDANGKRVATLTEAIFPKDMPLPERVSAIGRDGRTRMFGTLFKPSNFDPDRRYPVIHYVYGGPQTNNAPLGVEDFTSQYSQGLAEIGFIVLTVDGMGTPGRTKTFHQVAFGAGFKDCGLADAIAVMRALARSRAYIDDAKVGITGFSGGGYCSTRAMLDYPGVFDVGVSLSGSHDQLIDGYSWGETYIGRPAEHPDFYRAQDNAAAAANLTGKLLLIHGELDDDTPVANTMRVAAALIRSHRDFDMLIVPGANHSIGEDRYTYRRIWDYFIRNLAHDEADVFSFAWPTASTKAGAPADTRRPQ